MNNKQTIRYIKAYQGSSLFHPMTCGNDSNHKVLEPIEKDGKVILICLDCDYVQEYIPECVINPIMPG